MKISVVTAVRNGRDTIGATLQSLRGQTYPQIEHVVQDGLSTDGTIAFVHENGLLGMAFRSCQDAGIYDAINQGIARASGDVIGLLHADDVLASSDILTKVAQILSDKSIDGVYGDLQYVARDDDTRVVRHWTAGPYDKARLRRGWMPPHPTLYLRRSVYEQAGAYDIDFRIAGDYEAMLRFLTVTDVRLAYLSQVMVRMKLGGISNRSMGHMLRKSREDYRAIRRHKIGGMGTLIAKNLSKVRQFRVGRDV